MKKNFVNKERSFDSRKKNEKVERYSKPIKKETRIEKKPQREFNVNDEFDMRNDRLEGRNPIIEALKAGKTIDKLFVLKGKREGSIFQIIAMAKENGVVIQEVEKTKLDEMSRTHSHQGVIAFVSEHSYVDVEDILVAASKKGEQPFIIILDEITDPHNLGSVLRSANASGAHGVIIPKRRSVGLSAIVAKSSAGAIEYVPVAKVSNIAQTIDYLKKQGIWVIGTDADGSKVYYNTELKGPIAIVIGSEGEGMGRLVKEKCDYLVKIPMKGEITSLNAGVAAAILMFEVSKQRGY